MGQTVNDETGATLTNKQRIERDANLRKNVDANPVVDYYAFDSQPVERVQSMKDCIVTLNGRWVHVLFCDNVDNGDSDGHYIDNHKDGPIIRIDKSKPVESVIETLIHEILHAQLPDLSEDCVTRVGYETTKALYETGVIT